MDRAWANIKLLPEYKNKKQRVQGVNEKLVGATTVKEEEEEVGQKLMDDFDSEGWKSNDKGIAGKDEGSVASLPKMV